MFCRGEILQHLLRGAEKHQLAAPVEQDRLVEHLKNLGSRLVNSHDHNFVMRHPADDLDHVLGILGRESARGFVKKIDVSGADHVQPDVQPFAFSA